MIEREIVFEDRTPAHADHVGFGFERKTTAAVGKDISKHFGLEIHKRKSEEKRLPTFYYSRTP